MSRKQILCKIIGHKEERKMWCHICGRCRKILWWD